MSLNRGPTLEIIHKWASETEMQMFLVTQSPLQLGRVARENEAREAPTNVQEFILIQSDPDLPGPDLPEPRSFTGRVNFPKNRKFTVFDPDIPGTPIYRSKSFPPSIPVNRGPTVPLKSDPDLVTPSGERVLVTKSGWPLNRGQIPLISYIGGNLSCH
eukprot:sb/3473000/